MDRKEPEREKPAGKKESPATEREKSEEEEESPATDRKPLWIVAGILSVVILGIVILLTIRHCDRVKEVPSPQKKTFVMGSVKFYQDYLESMGSLNKGKALFSRGRALMGNSPETLPESAEETASASPLFRAAESFALAIEQIEHAEDLMKSDLPDIPAEDHDCRDALADNFKKYGQAIRIFNEYTKARYQGDIAKTEKFALSDGTAKWTMAETLMAKYYSEGCKGRFFGFVREQSDDFRRKVFEAYRDFFGDDFKRRSATLSLLIGYLPVAESRPAESSSPSPSRMSTPAP